MMNSIFRRSESMASLGVLSLLFYFGYFGQKMYTVQGGDYGILLFTAFFLLAAFAATLASPSGLTRSFVSILVATAVLIQIGFLVLLTWNPLLLYARNGVAADWLMVSLYCALALSLAQLVLLGAKHPLSGRWRLATRSVWLGVVGFLLVAHVLVIFASPISHIDVFFNNTMAADFFLHGLNPYTQDYPDGYNGRYAYKPGFLYFPGILLWQLPFRLLFGDIRFGFVFAQILVVYSILKISERQQKAELTGPVLAGLWLAFPITLFVLEQAWTDTVLVALAYLSAWMLVDRKWAAAGALLGLQFALKQYAFLFPVLGVWWIWRSAGGRAAGKAALSAVLAFSLVVLPFALANWPAFYQATVLSHLNNEMRLDSFSLTAYFAGEWGWRIPGALQVIFSLVGLVLGAGVIWREKPGQAFLHSLPAALFVAFGFAFLFGKQAFCNYYYLLASLVILVVLLKVPGEAPAPYPRNGYR